MDKKSPLFQLMDLRMNVIMNDLTSQDEDYQSLIKKSDECTAKLDALMQWIFCSIPLRIPSERFVKDIMKDIKKCLKIQYFQALPQFTYSVIFTVLHIVFNQTDNFVIHTLPALSAVMEWYIIGGVAYFLGKSFALFLRFLGIITFSHFTIFPPSATKK